METMEYQQMQIKKSFDRRTQAREFHVGDMVLKQDVLKSRPGQHNKFDHMWAGPFQIAECKQNNVYQLATMEGDILPIPVNEIHLKPCFEV